MLPDGSTENMQFLAALARKRMSLAPKALLQGAVQQPKPAKYTSGFFCLPLLELQQIIILIDGFVIF